jgi:serine/threonine-protein kinase
VVHTYGANEDKGRLYIAMEYLDGQPWSQVRHALWSNRSLPLAMHIKVLVDTLAGLHYAHELRDYDGKALEVVHRDMSPQNTFVTYDGQIKLVDFGVARVVTSQPQHAPLFVGKLAYSAPEQLRAGAIDRRADIFAVGVMLWEALAGRRLMEGQERTQAARRRASEPAPRIREVVPSVPRILETICERALALDPDDRFATAAEFREALNGYLNETGQPVDPAQIGQLVSDAFREQRRRINGLIEISLSDPGPPPRPVENVIETPRAPAGTDHTIRADLSELASVSKLSDEQLLLEASTSASVRIEKPRRTLTLGIAAVSAIALFLSWLAVRHVEPPPEVIATPLPPKPEPARAAARPNAMAELAARAAPTEVQLTLSASPASATIFMDGAPLPSNPYAARVRSDGEMHLIRISAPGAQAQERVVAFDRDKELHFALVMRSEQAVARARPAAAAPNAAARPRRSGPDAPGAHGPAPGAKDPEFDMQIPTDRPPRAIYEEDPY